MPDATMCLASCLKVVALLYECARLAPSGYVHSMNISLVSAAASGKRSATMRSSLRRTLSSVS